MMDDAELLRRYAAEGDEGAFAEFVRKNAGLVVASAERRLGGDGHRAREVAQRVFIAAARNARALATHRSVTGWLFTATRNAAVNLMRDEERRARREREAAEAIEVQAREMGVEARWAEVTPRLEQAMDALGERDREAVLLRYFAELPLAEVGRKLGLTENAARMRVQRALEKLNAMLARGGATAGSVTGLGAALSGRASVAVSGEVAAGLAKGAIAQAASATAGGLIFMSATKWAMGIAGACALVGVAGLWSYSRAELREVEAARRQVASRVSESQKAHADAQRRAGESEAEAAALEKRVGQAHAELAAAKVREAQAPRWDPVAEGTAFMARNPEVKRALDRYVVAANWFKYGALFKERGWSDAQIAEFIELTTTGASMGALLGNGNSVSLRYGDGKSPPGVGERLQRLLGSDGLLRWDQLRQELAGKYVAREVASALYFTDTPLSAEQARELVQIVTETKPPKAVSGVIALKWDEVLGKARAKLAPEQVAAIEVLRAKGEFNRLFSRPRDASGAVLPTKGKATP